MDTFSTIVQIIAGAGYILVVLTLWRTEREQRERMSRLEARLNKRLETDKENVAAIREFFDRIAVTEKRAEESDAIRALLKVIADRRNERGLGDCEAALGHDGARALYEILDAYLP